MLELEYTTQFKRDLKLSKKRGKNLSKLDLPKSFLMSKLSCHWRDN